MSAQANPLGAQIEQARKHGYKDDEITSYLGSNHPELAPKIRQAVSAGYKPDEILGYLSKQSATSTPEPTLTQKAIAQVAKTATQIPEIGKGMFKEALREVEGMENFFSGGLTRALTPKKYQEEEKKRLQISNPEQQAGATGLQYGQYLIPAELPEVAVAKGAPMLTRAVGKGINAAIDMGAKTFTSSGGDPKATAEGIATGGAFGAAFGAAEPVIAAAGKKVAAAGKAALHPIKTVNDYFKVDPEVALARALKPEQYKNSFLQHVDTVVPDVINYGRKIIKGNEDLIVAAKNTIGELKGAFNDWVDNARRKNWTIDGDAIVAATRNAISSTMWRENPEAAQALIEEAQRAYGGQKLTVDEATRLLKEKTDQLESLYDKSPGKQHAAVSVGKPEAIVKAQRDAIQQTFYNTLDPAGKGEGPRQIQARAGHVIDLLDAAEKQRIAIKAEKPISKADATGKRVAAAVNLSGKVLHGNVEEGVGNLVHAKSGKSDPLIQRAFSRKAQPKPIPRPNPLIRTGSTPRGLLGPGPKITPPPADTSGPIKGPGPQMGRGMSPDIGTRRLAPPSGPIRPMPPVADTSGPVQGAGFANPGQGGASTRRLPPPSRVQSGGFAVGEDMVPVMNPQTGQYEYVAKWTLQKPDEFLTGITKADDLHSAAAGSVSQISKNRIAKALASNSHDEASTIAKRAIARGILRTTPPPEPRVPPTEKPPVENAPEPQTAKAEEQQNAKTQEAPKTAQPPRKPTPNTEQPESSAAPVTEKVGKTAAPPTAKEPVKSKTLTAEPPKPPRSEFIDQPEYTGKLPPAKTQLSKEELSTISEYLKLPVGALEDMPLDDLQGMVDDARAEEAEAGDTGGAVKRTRQPRGNVTDIGADRNERVQDLVDRINSGRADLDNLSEQDKKIWNTYLDDLKPTPSQPKYEKPPIRDKANAPLPEHIQSADPEVQEAYKRLQRLKSEKGSTNPSGQEPVDIEKFIPDMVTVGKHYLKLGANNFQSWSEKMVADFGEKVRPVLQRAWESVSGESSGPRRVEEKSPVGQDDQFKKKVFLQNGKVTEMTRHELDTDPKQFQYKTKAVGKGGVTDKMKDVDFDPESAGVLAVWKDPGSGKTYVVNGHHRLERAHAAKYDDPLLVRHLSAKTAGEARMAGALINIREGNGDVIDAAKVFREGGFDADKLKKFNISRNSPIAKGGLALSKLDDQVFEDVSTGKIPEDKGVVIGETLDNPADQKAAAKLAIDLENRNRRVTPSEFRETLNFIKNGPKKTATNQDLFGSYEVEKNLYVEKGEVSDYIKNQLSTETKLFATVGKEKNAALLQGTGNQINAEANAARSQQAAQALDVYNRLKNVSGPVADILDSAAKELAEGGKPGEVKQRAYQRIFDQLGKDLSQIFGGGDAKTGGGSGSAGGTEGVRLSAGVRAGEQQGLGTEPETEKFNKSQAESRQSAEMKAKLNSKIGQGDRGHVVERSSPLFKGEPIEERRKGEAKPSPQASMFDETEKPKGKTGAPPKAPESTQALTRDEKATIDDYKNFGFGKVNERLRSGEPLDDEQKETVAMLDSAIAKNKLTKDTDLYRGIAGMHGADMAQLKPGAIIPADRGFVSTTSSPFVVRNLYDDGSGAILHIKAKAGQPAYIDNPKEYVEGEHLLPRGTKFKVISVEKGNGTPVVTVEIAGKN